MKTVRVFFAKEGRLKYISHLAVTRCLARVFKRSRLPIWYTQGFNPHAYLTFALPLPLGVESCCESFDFRLTEEVSCEEVTDRLNAGIARGGSGHGTERDLLGGLPTDLPG